MNFNIFYYGPKPIQIGLLCNLAPFLQIFNPFQPIWAHLVTFPDFRLCPLISAVTTPQIFLLQDNRAALVLMQDHRAAGRETCCVWSRDILLVIWALPGNLAKASHVGAKPLIFVAKPLFLAKPFFSKPSMC